MDTFRDVSLPMGDKTISVAVVRGTDRRRLQFLRGDGVAIMQRFLNEECVLISESFERRHHLERADALVLTTPDGPRRFSIAGRFYDYTRDQGVVYISTKTFRQFWNDDRIHSLAIYLQPGGSADALNCGISHRIQPDRAVHDPVESRSAGCGFSRSSIRHSLSPMSSGRSRFWSRSSEFA